MRSHQTFCVVGHVRPDGDCIGSQLAMTLALQSQGKKVECWNEDVVPQKLAFLDPDQLVSPPKNNGAFDCVIALDCASYQRLGVVVEHIQNRKQLINIDHHASNTRYGDLNWISAKAPSTGEMIYQLLKAANWPITPRIADCLFTAVSTDTGSFQYPTTQPATYQAAGELVKCGANLEQICDEVYQSYPLSRVRLLQHVFNNFRLTQNNQVAYFWLRKEDFNRTGANASDSEGLIDHIRAIEPVVVACVFEEVEPNQVRISLRSKSPKVDVNQIAKQFDGGGHSAAAGARITGSPVSIQRRVLAAIKKALNSAD
jgi:phosphoesterase RecJ-like protein